MPLASENLLANIIWKLKWPWVSFTVTVPVEMPSDLGSP